VANPRLIGKGLAGYVWYLRDWRRYSRLPGAEPLRWIDSMPQVHDRTATTPFDAHYFYLNGWAMRRIVALAPPSHLDIGSAVTFVSLLAAVTPVYFVDYRPLPARCAGMEPLAGDITSLPFASESAHSLSCLHVAEHIGLGRYGDPLDADGARKAARELTRILAPGGSLFLGLPVGIARTCFNAHRIHAARAIREYFAGLELVEFSGVHDDGAFVERAALNEFEDDAYACGMFWFRKPAVKA
jgi:SAM-dependent methyltransferase